VKLLRDLEQKGIILTPKLTFKSAIPLDAETLELLYTHKAKLLREVASTCFRYSGVKL